MLSRNNDYSDDFYYELACRTEEIILEDAKASMPSDDELKDIDTFSEGFERKMKLLIGRFDRRKAISRTVKRIIVIAAILAALIAGALSVSAIREKLCEIFVKDLGGHAVATYREVSGSDWVSIYASHEDICYYYEPTYIPEGYEEISRDCWGVQRRITYCNGKNEFTFTQSTICSMLQMDNEHADIQTVDVNGTIASHANNNGMTVFIWDMAGYSLKINANFSVDEIVRIAESVEISY